MTAAVTRLASESFNPFGDTAATDSQYTYYDHFQKQLHGMNPNQHNVYANFSSYLLLFFTFELIGW